MTKQEKFYNIELLRFLCAFAVLLWHYAHFLYGIEGVNRLQQPFYYWFYPFFTKGYYGVQVFWMISGYIFFRQYRDSIANRNVDFRKFFLRRIARLYPLHIVTLIIVALLQPLFFLKNGNFFIYQSNSVKYFILQLFMASHWFPNTVSSFNEPIWSVSVEIIVYFVFFLHMRFIGSSILSTLAILGSALCLLLASGYRDIFWCTLFFYTGGVITCVQDFFTGIPPEQKRKYSWSFLLLAVEVFLCMAIAYADQRFRFLILSAVAFYIILEYIRIPERHQKLVEALGNLTYASYLIHFPIQLSIATFCSYIGCAIPFRSPIFFLAFIGGIFLLSRIVFLRFESVARNKIRQFFNV
ncbi:MAG: acyltransferase [Puniceicoccales bacterium]|nr:acyltransferase [Puniceicoccales bacterium]